MKLTNMHELFIMQIKDLYSAEAQLTKALPKMAKASTNKNLKKGFEQHLKETEGHLERLEKIAKNLDFSPKNHRCLAMKGLVEEGAELLTLDADPAVLDAALIGAAQRVEHYEIAAYGTVITLAKLMGHDKEAELLEKTLEEEKQTDVKLSMIAEDEVNQSANTGM